MSRSVIERTKKSSYTTHPVYYTACKLLQYLMFVYLPCPFHNDDPCVGTLNGLKRNPYEGYPDLKSRYAMTADLNSRMKTIGMLHMYSVAIRHSSSSAASSIECSVLVLRLVFISPPQPGPL